KDKYLVAGMLNNRSAKEVTFSATLLETNVSPQPAVDPPGEKALATLGGGAALAGRANTPVTFGQVDLSKSWGWFIFGIFLENGPILQNYTYRVRVDMPDPYQNAFPPFFTTPNLTVSVLVSGLKFSAFATAVGLTTAAAGFLILAAAVALV